MYKELVISIIIVIIIITLDCTTQKYTEKTINETTQKLSELKDDIKNDSSDKEKISNKVNEIYDFWNENHDKLAFYIEHDELEKVETDFVACKSLIESERYDIAISELEKTVFVLDHISDKYAFNLINIF